MNNKLISAHGIITIIIIIIISKHRQRSGLPPWIPTRCGKATANAVMVRWQLLENWLQSVSAPHQQGAATP